MDGKKNIVVGLFVMAGFMLYGFLLIYLRDFAPNAAEWAAAYGNGKHFEARLAHVHGNLFGFLNIMIGYLLFQLELTKGQRAWVSWTSLVGLLMPIGILLELVLGAPPYFVLIGAISMTAGIFLLGLFVLKSKLVLAKK
ncbi:MAG: hypothetical protein COT73_06350 [Bdellovibrio sp. CG10_big_fil_rev_8_21_14_0_10_47_8]|nr:MAG: hypothetical protein COT73_06350 [Bdellovibrio sp. CG10_big_fil_rev_8_21_14_0_10_47_8]